MSAKLEQKLAEMLNMDENTAGNALQKLVSEIKRRVKEGETVAVPRLGVFRLVDDALVFEADPELEAYVNAEFAGLSDVPISPEKAERLKQTLAPGMSEPSDRPKDEAGEGEPPEESDVQEDSEEEVTPDEPQWSEKIESKHADEHLGEHRVEDAEFEVVEGSGREAEELAVLQALGGSMTPRHANEDEPEPPGDEPAEPELDDSAEETPPVEEDSSEMKAAETDEAAAIEKETKAEKREREEKLTRSGRMKGIYRDAMRERRESRKVQHERQSRRRIVWFAIPMIVIVALGSWFVIGLLVDSSQQDAPPPERIDRSLEDERPDATESLVADSTAAAAETDSMEDDSATAPAPPDEPDEDPARSGASAVPEADGNYAWIVGSSPDRAAAEQMLGRYTNAGMPGELVEAVVNDRTVYRVAIGRYESVEAANAGRDALPSFAPEDMWIRNIGPPG